MTAAIFGLIGVIVGAAVAGGVDLHLERRREMREIKRTKRLIGDELHTAWMHLTLCMESRRFPAPRTPDLAERFMPTSVWDIHKSVMADDRALSDLDWGTLSIVEYNVDGTRGLLLDDVVPGDPIPTDQYEQVVDLADMVAAMYEVVTGRTVGD